MSLRQGVAAPPPCAGVHRACAAPYSHATKRASSNPGCHSPVSFVKSPHAHQCRECPAEAAPYAGTLPSSLAMACGVVAGGSASLPSIPSVSQGPPGQSRRSTSIGRDLGPRAVSRQFLRPRGVGPARAALKLAAQPKNPRCGERHGPQATWRHSLVELS